MGLEAGKDPRVVVAELFGERLAVLDRGRGSRAAVLKVGVAA